MNWCVGVVGILLLVVLIIPVAALEPDGCGGITNGNFETGDFSNWDFDTFGGEAVNVSIVSYDTYAARLCVDGHDGGPYIRMTTFNIIDTRDVKTISFNYTIVKGTYDGAFVVYMGSGEPIDCFEIDCGNPTGKTQYIHSVSDHTFPTSLSVYVASGNGELEVIIDDINISCEILPCGGLINGDFETGDLMGWTDRSEPGNEVVVGEEYTYNENYGVRLCATWNEINTMSSIYQTIDCTDIYSLYITYKIIQMGTTTEEDPGFFRVAFVDEYSLLSDYDVSDEWITKKLNVFGEGEGAGEQVLELYAWSATGTTEVYIDNITCVKPTLPTPDCSLTNGDFEAECDYEEDPVPGWTQDGQQVAWWYDSHSYSYGFQSIYADVAVNGELVPFFELTQSANFDDRTNLTFAYIAWFTDDFTVEIPQPCHTPLSNFSVFIDDDLIFFTNESTLDYGDPLEWVVEDIDISGYGYTGNHTVKIELNVNYSMNYESILSLDNVCLYSPASTCAPITGPITGNESTYENITFTGTCGTCENAYTYHFEYSATPDGFTMYTEPLTLPSSASPNDSVEILSPYFPYIDGQTYYYRLARDDGEVGETLTFQVGAYSVTPVPTSTYTEEYYEPFVEAEWDIAELAGIVPVPYFARFGYLLWAIFWGAILMAFWVRQEDVTIPAFMYLIIFFTLDLADLLPSSFVTVSWVFAGICLGAILYTLFRGRKHG